MLGILLLFFIGKFFYQLAEKYSKNKWGLGILGVVTYYAGTMVFGLIYGIIYFTKNPYADENDLDELSLTLMAIPVGLLFAYGLYFFLKKTWKKNKREEEPTIDDIGKS